MQKEELVRFAALWPDADLMLFGQITRPFFPPVNEKLFLAFVNLFHRRHQWSGSGSWWKREEGGASAKYCCTRCGFWKLSHVWLNFTFSFSKTSQNCLKISRISLKQHCFTLCIERRMVDQLCHSNWENMFLMPIFYLYWSICPKICFYLCQFFALLHNFFASLCKIHSPAFCDEEAFC